MDSFGVYIGSVSRVLRHQQEDGAAGEQSGGRIDAQYMRVYGTAVYAASAVQIHAGDDERNTVFCAAIGSERSSADGVEIGYRAEQLDFCIHFAQTIALVGSQSYASDATHMDIFGERLNGWQWAGVLIAIGTIFLFSFTHKSEGGLTHTQEMYKYYFCLALAILIGACSGLYDKFLMRRYDHNAVQVYYTLYQAVMMLIVWSIAHKRESGKVSIKRVGVIMLISIFLIISDNVYMLALRDPDSLIAVVSTIRRGGTVIGFAYGLIFLQEKNAIPKICCMAGIILGLICLALGSM